MFDGKAGAPPDALVDVTTETLKPTAVPLTGRLAELLVQVDPDGAPVHERVTLPAKPDMGETAKLNIAVPPAAVVADSEPPVATWIAKSVPVPVSAT